MASIRVRQETGQLFFDFRYLGHRCREQTTLADTPANRKQMEQILKKIDAEISLGTFSYRRYFPNSKLAARFDAVTEPGVYADRSGSAPSRQYQRATPTVREFAALYCAEQSITWRENTKLWMRSLFDAHILPGLGDDPVGEVTRERVLRFRAVLANKKSKSGKTPAPQTINAVMGALSRLFAEAADRYGFESPTVRIKALKKPKAEIFPLSLQEVQQILAAIRPDYRTYVLVRFFTGMRSGEVDGLKWENVDFNRRVIMVRETYTHGRFDYTKNDGSQRDIAMSQPVYDALLAHRPTTPARGELVFCTKAGTPVDAKNFTTRVWYPLLRHLDLRLRRPYQTRHTCATLWLAAGENPEWIARQLGHTTTEMLFKTYSRYVPNLTRQDGSAFDRMLAGLLTPSGAQQANDTSDAPTDKETAR